MPLNSQVITKIMIGPAVNSYSGLWCVCVCACVSGLGPSLTYTVDVNRYFGEIGSIDQAQAKPNCGYRPCILHARPPHKRVCVCVRTYPHVYIVAAPVSG